MTGNGRCNREIEAGISCALEFALVFAEWAESLGGGLTQAAIVQRFGCSRATSYRWFNAWQAMKARRA